MHAGVAALVSLKRIQIPLLEQVLADLDVTLEGCEVKQTTVGEGHFALEL